MVNKKRPTVAVDFDNTLVEWLEDGRCIAKPGAKKALTSLRSRGCKIVIHTCRIGISRVDGKMDAVVEEISNILDELDLPYDAIHLGSKVIADAYIDDRAVPYRGNWDETLEDAKRMMFRQSDDS